MLQYFDSVCPATASSLMRVAAGAAFNVVDIYCNSTSAAACQAPATTSAPSTTAPASTAAPPPSTTAPATTSAPSQGAWSTAQLSLGRFRLAAASVGNVALFAGGAASGFSPYAVSNVVDVYNGAIGAWSTAQLSLARFGLAAASVGNLALFAGGYSAGALATGWGQFLCVC